MIQGSKLPRTWPFPSSTPEVCKPKEAIVNPMLKPCPHCGGIPWFSDYREKDDRRYVQMELECCSIMKSSISWPSFNTMTREEITSALQEDLTLQWNKRYNPNNIF